MNESQFRYKYPRSTGTRFLLMDKKGKFALLVSEDMCATAEHDFGGIVDNMDLSGLHSECQ